MERLRRVNRHLGCDLRHETECWDGIVMDFSRDGLFVLTEATVPPGTQVEVLLNETPSESELTLRTIVVRQRLIRLRDFELVSIGLGLRVLHAPQEYYERVARQVSEGTASPRRGWRAGLVDWLVSAFRVTISLFFFVPRSSQRLPDCVDRELFPTDAAPVPSPTDDGLAQYRIRLHDKDGGTVRTVVLAASSAGAAHEDLECVLSPEWQIESVEPD